MTTMQQFLDERDGKFTDKDVMFLARVGVESLLPCPDFLKPLDGEQEDIDAVKEVEPSDYHIYSLFGVEIGHLAVRIANEELETIRTWVSSLASAMPPRVIPRVLVVGSRFGEEVIAACAGSGVSGDNVQTVYDWRLRHDENEKGVYDSNLGSCPLCEKLMAGYEVQDGESQAWSWEPQEYDMVVACGVTTVHELEGWLRHVSDNGYLTMVGSNRVADELFEGDVQHQGECCIISKTVVLATREKDAKSSEPDVESHEDAPTETAEA